MDREKIIKEWETVLSRDPLDATWDLIDDTLALLKEHEAVTVESIQMDRSDKWGADLSGYCPSCKRPLKSRFNQRFCGECGQAVKWG